MIKKTVFVFVCILLFSLAQPNISSTNEQVEVPDDECPCLSGIIITDYNELEGETVEILDDIPLTWDWRNVNGKDWTTPIKDQLQDICGSCWAFGALGGLEAYVKIWENNPDLNVDLSEQYMLSCSSGGCDGWYWMSTLNWIKAHGAIPESCLEYEADDTIPCDAKCEEWDELLVGIESFHKIKANITQIQSALVQYGPLPATMLCYEDFYPNYTGGVYEYTYGDLVFGHCITIVGYNDSWGDEDEGYWIVKNSWGTEWGEDGWFRIKYGECEMEKGVHYYIGPNYPADKPETPEGPTSGSPRETYSYSSVVDEPDGDPIKYYFDWGDGNTSWTDYVAAGEMVTMNYSWEKQGDYDVRVMAKDEHGLESAWSDPLTVSVPRNKFVKSYDLFFKFSSFFSLQRFISLI